MEEENCEQIRSAYRNDGPLDIASHVNLECCNNYDDINLSEYDEELIRQKSTNLSPSVP